MKSFTLALLAITFSALCVTASAFGLQDVVVERVRPETIYAEYRNGLTRLNFDVELRNTGAESVTLTYLELRVFDSDNNVLARRYMGGNGLPGPIEMLPEREILPGEALYIFNPFPDLRLELPAARLQFRAFYTGGHVVIDRTLHDVPGPVLLRPPVAGRTYIYSGNDLASHHRRVALSSAPAVELGMDRITQRFALDFTAIDPGTGDLAANSGSDSEDWFAYGRQVVSPANGRIVAARADLPDNTFDANGNRIFAEGFETSGENRSLGNYLIIETGGAFLLMSHFEQHSLAVGMGDEVYAGQALGRIGLSGDTAYPHLHIQMQDTPDILTANPLPIIFDCAIVQSSQERRIGVDTGDFVEACD